MIGIDPHQGSHTGAAIDPTERELGHLLSQRLLAAEERVLDVPGHPITFAVLHV